MLRRDYFSSLSDQGSPTVGMGKSGIIEIPAGTTGTERRMLLTRRRRTFLNVSSSPVNTVDAQGTAYLCFPEDHSWFQGNISTDDESNYSLYGERISTSNDDGVRITESGAKNDINGNVKFSDNMNDKRTYNESTKNENLTYYCVTMIDHFSGQKYILPKLIYMRRVCPISAGAGYHFASQHDEVTFQVENIYKGQKADMMIHRYLGAASLLGKKCLLYSGQINIFFNEIAETGRSWSL